jgi:predicted transcriptional regulator
MMGRPPTGVRPGERLTDYKQVTVRLPPETVAQLEQLSEKLERPQWRIMCDAIAVLSRVGVQRPIASTAKR